MKKNYIKLLLLLLLSSILISCKGIQWGNSFEDISKGLYTTVKYYSADETVCVERSYIIGSMYTLPGSKDTIGKEMGKPGYFPSDWILMESAMTADELKEAKAQLIYSGDDPTKIAAFLTGYNSLCFKVNEWTAGLSEYKVEYYEENINDDGFELVRTEVLSATTDSLVTITPEEKSGFDVTSAVDVSVKGDGSTVVQIYYKRRIVTIKVASVLDAALEPFFTVSAKYGATIDWTGFVAPEMEGNKLAGWFSLSAADMELLAADPSHYAFAIIEALPDVMPADNLWLFANWSAIPKANWTIYYYIQNADNDEYTYVDDYSTLVEGYVGDSITETLVKQKYEEPDITWFTYERCEIIGDGIVTEDNSAYVNVYFTRNLVTVTIDLGGGKIDGEEWTSRSYRVGSTLYTQVPAPVKPGWSFTYWYDVVGTIYPATYQIFGNEVLIAYYEPAQVDVGNVTVTIVPSTTEIKEPASPVTTTATATGISFKPQLPEGIYTYSWTLDGTDKGDGETYEVDISSMPSGTYQVICIATDQNGNVYVCVKDFEVKQKINLTGAGD